MDGLTRGRHGRTGRLPDRGGPRVPSNQKGHYVRRSDTRPTPRRIQPHEDDVEIDGDPMSGFGNKPPFEKREENGSCRRCAMIDPGVGRIGIRFDA